MSSPCSARKFRSGKKQGSKNVSNGGESSRVAERGAKPQVSALRRRTLDAVSSLFSPLLPDDYLELINPLWTTQELRGRIERIDREAGNAVTVLIRPGY